MTHILLIAPRQELILHNIPVTDNSDIKKIEAFIQNKLPEYGEIERLILSMGTVRIMEPGEQIPIPLKSAGGADEMSEIRQDLITVLNTLMLGALMLHSFMII